MLDEVIAELSQLEGTALWLYIGSLVGGALLLVLNVLTSQMKTIQGIMIFKIAANLTMCVTDLLRGEKGYTGAAVAFLAMLMCVAVYLIRKKGKEPGIPFLVCSAVVYVGFLAFTYREPKDILAIVCAVLFVVALGIKDTFTFRCLYLISYLMWIPYDFAAALFTQMLTHVVTEISYLVGIIRHDLPERRKKAQHDAQKG